MVPVTNLITTWKILAMTMAWNAELSNKLLRCARIGQAPEKYLHTQISLILIALFTSEIYHDAIQLPDPASRHMAVARQ